MNTMLRQWAMLKLVPRYPRRIDTAVIRDRLAAQGYRTTLRTIQRDLNKLEAVLPLCGDDSKPQGWCWQKDAAALDIPGLDAQTALAFKMVESHLTHVLPAATLDALSPWFKSASVVLESQRGGLATWMEKVRILPRGQVLLPPKIDAEVQEAIYRGTLEDLRIDVAYRPHGATISKQYEISPLGLVQRDRLVYVVCTIRDYADIKLLLLHRILSAVVSGKAVCRPEGFNIDDYIADGELGFRVGCDIELVADVDASVAAMLYETPLAEEQILIKKNGGAVRLTATVPNTLVLRSWLRSFGSKVKVVNPAALLDETEPNWHEAA